MGGPCSGALTTEERLSAEAYGVFILPVSPKAAHDADPGRQARSQRQGIGRAGDGDTATGFQATSEGVGRPLP